jgi:hypothetical protein
MSQIGLELKKFQDCSSTAQLLDLLYVRYVLDFVGRFAFIVIINARY